MWWTREQPGTSHRVIGLHVDLAGHSKWAEEHSVDMQAAVARREFGVILELRLERTGFECLFWAGDGGLFVRRYDRDPAEFEKVAQAAQECFSWFEKWNAAQSGQLKMRVLAVYIPKVIVYPQARHWFSKRLNALLKYERDLSFEGAFIVTDDLRCELDDQSDLCKHLVNPRRIPLRSGESITVWMDDRYPIKVGESPRRFWVWARNNKFHIPVRAGLPECPGFPTIGESSLLDGSVDERGYGPIELVYLPGVQAGVPTSAHNAWKAKRDDLVAQGRIGSKLAIVQFKGQQTDDPVSRLTCRSVPYEDVRAFHAVMAESVAQRLESVREALNVTRDSSKLPNILCSHILVLLKNSKGGSDMLLAHRRKGERPGGYFDNCWSVSIEEQFLAVDEERKGKKRPRDRSITDTVLRGVKEELVGDNFVGQINVALHGLFLERSLLNYSFLAIAELPDTTFEEVAALWPDADDFTEHDALAALPLRSDLLTECLVSEQWPVRVREQARFADSASLDDADHRWHPSSPIRMALGLWQASLPQDEG